MVEDFGNSSCCDYFVLGLVGPCKNCIGSNWNPACRGKRSLWYHVVDYSDTNFVGCTNSDFGVGNEYDFPFGSGSDCNSVSDLVVDVYCVFVSWTSVSRIRIEHLECWEVNFVGTK